MDVKELAEKVQEVRQAQKDYFSKRTPSALELSKRLEKELDTAVHDILHPEIKNQIKMF